MKKVKVLVTAAAMSIGLAHAQYAPSVIKHTNVSKLKELSGKYSLYAKKQRDLARAYAAKHGVQIKWTDDRGRTIEMIGLNENGDPLYNITDNAGAAISTSAVKLYDGGGLGVDLAGEGMHVGVWDGGSALYNHQEFVDRLVATDGGDADDHATHVCGTVGASGVNSDAKGMAYKSTILTYDWGSDLSEMSSEAAQGLLLSNHSYGSGIPSSDANISAWGRYNNTAAAWDNVAYNAPYYQMVKSAGNSRGDGLNTGDGGYDLLVGASTAKNVLVVAAAEKTLDYTGPNSVGMSSFSSWGPTDDGRIKPDIAGAGVSVYSPTVNSSTSYGYKSGTSMAAPNVTGSLLLLQELYGRIHGEEYMRAATLRGLAIHTAKEAGAHQGPDYSYGWGLLDVAAGAHVIMSDNKVDHGIMERTLASGTTYEYEITSDGSTPIFATIAWTDQAGTPASNTTDNPASMLVADLDLRIIGPDNTEYMPWNLSVGTPSAAAYRGDNNRDNVERVEIDNPTAGTYTIRISHKGVLSPAQAYSLIFSTKSFATLPTAFYWVGGSGDWNDGGHWSNTSGGLPVNQVPTVNDIVFVNNISLSEGETITMDADGACLRMVWTDQEATALNLNGNTLTIDGAVTFPEALSVVGNGVLKFTGDLSPNNIMAFNGADLKGAVLHVDSELGNWELEDGFSAGGLILSGGYLSLNENEITVDSLVVDSSIAKELEANNTTLNCRVGFRLTGSGHTLGIMGTSFVIDGVSSNSFFEANGLEVDEVLVDAQSITFTGTNTFGLLDLNSDVVFENDNTVDELIFYPAKTISLAEGTDQNVLSVFDAIGEDGQMIDISSIGVAGASFSTDDASIKHCLDYINLTNVQAVGAALFIPGENSTLDVASTGWETQTCESILFADFEANFACLGSETDFLDMSSGGATSWTWDFGDGNGSTEQNPVHMYENTGSYMVSLTVSDGVDSYESIKEVIIIDPTFNAPSISLISNIMVISTNATNFQWYDSDDNPIGGATSSFYEPAVSGDYYAIVWDDDCRFVTDPYTYTSSNQVSAINKLEGKELTVYPNPTVGELVISFKAVEQGMHKVVLYDAHGKRVFAQQFDAQTIEIEKRLSISHLPKGIYLIEVISENDRYLNKVIKN